MAVNRFMLTYAILYRQCQNLARAVDQRRMQVSSTTLLSIVSTVRGGRSVYRPLERSPGLSEVVGFFILKPGSTSSKFKADWTVRSIRANKAIRFQVVFSVNRLVNGWRVCTKLYLVSQGQDDKSSCLVQASTSQPFHVLGEHKTRLEVLAQQSMYLGRVSAVQQGYRQVQIPSE